MTTKTASLPYLDTMAITLIEANQQKSPKFRAKPDEKRGKKLGIKNLTKSPLPWYNGKRQNKPKTHGRRLLL